MVSSSSSSRNWDHNVFPSFHGPDVRKGLLSHLLEKFKIKGIQSFIDNEIRRGESIGPELKRAIKGSKIALVLLSKNYASSSWCLDELVEIMNKELGQTVMTIFYDVDPTEVKKQTGVFGKVFGETCKGKTEEKIDTWRNALEGVATIAGYHLSNCFQLRAIMVNIKESYRQLGLDEKSAQLKLQSHMLSEMLNQKDIMVPNLGVAQERLKDKEIFLVLDDVDRLEQLDALAKETRWFGPRSRIIITTQDLRVLEAHGINHIYKVDFPSTHEAFQMVCIYAFGQKNPEYDFTELVWEVANLASQLPLGLKVMGSHFKRKSKQEWKNALPSLKNRLHADIVSVLKNSKIGMHSLLVKLGKDIVRKQFDEPGQRQFFVDSGENCEVLLADEAT
ncbi:predicted protein, partial [Arabidopsis lyrata subsp. lyrata]